MKNNEEGNKIKKAKKKNKISKPKTLSEFITNLKVLPLMVLWLRVSHKELCLLLQGVMGEEAHA